MNRPCFPWMMNLFLTLALCCVGAGADTNAREVEEDNSLASTFVTPHQEWAKPFAGGPVRALFFVYTGPYQGTWEDTHTRVRQVVELMERFDVQGEAVLFCGRGNKWVFHGLNLGEARCERLLQKPYDLYVIAGFSMEKLPAKIQYLVLKQVTQGAGLVFCGPGAPRYMTGKRQVKPTPPELTAGLPALDEKTPAQVVSAYRLGRGRGVWLRYDSQSLVPAPEFSRRELVNFEYRMLWVGRAVLWAARREGAVQVKSVFGDAALSVNRASPRQVGRVLLTGTGPKPVRVTPVMTLRRAVDGATVALPSREVTVTPGETSRLPVTLPRLRAGDYFLDVVVRSAHGVETCGAGALTVTSDFGIERVDLDRSFVEPGQTLRATVTLRGNPPAGSTLQVQFRDSYDRVQTRSRTPLKPGQTHSSFAYHADSLATIEMRAEAVLLVDGLEVDLKDALFTVPKRRHNRFNFVIWDAARDALGYYACRQVQRAGFEVCLLGSMGRLTQQPTALRACDFSLVPYSTRILDPKDDRGYMKPVCWNDEPAVGEYVQRIVDNQERLRQQGVFVYSLGDEGVTKGCCVHPACLAAYRRYLADRYGSIEKLNASWGTTYQSFAEVDLLDHSDNMENAAAKTCFPRWYDRQAFARFNLMQFSGRFVKAYRRLDPQALTGFEGTGGFGDDYDAILSINGFYGPYPSIGDDILRWVAPKALVNSNWMGYTKTGDALANAAWRMVMKGKNSIWYWMWSGIGNWRGYLRPTLDYWPAIEDLTREMRPVRRGLGDLLMNSEMTHSGIGIFYSLPSALSCRLEKSNQFLTAKSVHEAWTRWTYELGLDLRYLTSNKLRQDALTNDGFRVLLLPMTQALSREEAQVIRRFVENGGTVVADVRPGLFDEHCKPLKAGRLDEMFGIRRTGRGKAVEAPLSLSLTLAGKKLSLRLDKVRLDAEVTATTGTALVRVEQTPAFIVNHVGRGTAILLNFQLLTSKPATPAAAQARRLLRFLYQVAGVRGIIRVTSPEGSPLPLTETRVWRNGEALVFGLWRHMENAWFSPKSGTTAGQPVAVRISLPTARYVYDLRAGKYRGRVNRVDTHLRWGRASFYLASPYPLRRLTLGTFPKTPRRGSEVTVGITLSVPRDTRERQAVWVSVTDPEGNHPLWGNRVVLLKRGEGTTRFRVAWNDLPGRWRVTATELFSRCTAQASWHVE